MKHKLLTNALIFLFAMVFIYLCTSFSVWDLNPSHWSKDLRSVFSIMTPCISMLIVAFSNFEQLR